MKKVLRNILIVILAVSAAVCAAIGLSACGGTKLQELRIENAKTSFKIGDEFELGEDFKVYAVYSDGTETDVTAEATTRQEAGMDMNVAGNYQITVSWNGKKEIYTIYVSDFDNILRKIELDTTAVKKTYSLGDEATFNGLKIKCTYENAQGQYIESTTTSLKDFKLEIVGENNYRVTEVFDKLGEYTVTVSMGSIKASFKLNVSGVNIDTVLGAISVATAFKDNVVSGTYVMDRAFKGEVETFREYDYSYEFGDNYVHMLESAQEPKNEFHLSMENSDIFCVQLQNGQKVPNNTVNSGYMQGTPFLLWYNRFKCYGIESTLAHLYQSAKECTNKDFVETADPVTRTYSFSFSGLVTYSNVDDYYETTVSFTLGEDYIIKHAEYVQLYYENNTTNPDFPPAFIVEDGVAKPNPVKGKGYFSAKDIVTVDQTSGERTLTNPYSSDNTHVKSYELSYQGKELGDNGVIDCSMASPNFTIDITNLVPSTADFTIDNMYFDYEGNYGSEVDSAGLGVTSTGFMAFRRGNSISIILRNGGVWKLKIRTSATYKTVTFNVTGVAPTSITAQLGNASTGKFVNGNSKTVAIGGSVYLRGAVNQYANEAQTAKVTSGNSATATVEETMLGGVKCFVFKATAAGNYTVTVASSASFVQCTINITVSDMPDFAELLNGKYTATDKMGDEFLLEFNPLSATEDNVSGTVVVTKTDTENNKKTTQTLKYSVDFDNIIIVLTPVSGEALGVDLKISEANELVLEDQYGSERKLNRVTE